MKSSCSGLVRRNLSGLINQLKVSAGGHADVVRENDCAFKGILTVDGVDSAYQRNAKTSLKCLLLEAIKIFAPLFRSCAWCRSVRVNN